MTTESIKNRPGDQQLPSGGKDAIQPMLIRILESRTELGVERYGQALMSWNGRNGVRDGFEEALDLTVYLLQIMREIDDLHHILTGMLQVAADLESGEIGSIQGGKMIRSFVTGLRTVEDAPERLCRSLGLHGRHPWFHYPEGWLRCTGRTDLAVTEVPSA